MTSVRTVISRHLQIVAACFFAVLPAATLHAQSPGITVDWSNRHVVRAQPQSAADFASAAKDARQGSAFMARAMAITRAATRANSLSVGADGAADTQAAAPALDWTVTLPGVVPDGQFPALFIFPSATPSPNNFIVFGTNNGPTSGSVVVYNNLYATPVQVFRKDFGSPVLTSPVVALEATKIAFVEAGTSGGTASFHVVDAKTGADVTGSPISLTSTDGVTLPLAASSPFVDYEGDTAYVGTDDGKLHKITTVFRGTPTLSASWQVASVNSSSDVMYLTSPTLTGLQGQIPSTIFVGGSLAGSGVTRSTVFKVDATNGTVTTPVFSSAPDLEFLASTVLDAPIVDAQNLTVFVTGVVASSSRGAVVQSDINFSGDNVGEITPGATTMPLRSGTFDNAWFTSSNGTGNYIACGTGGSSAVPTLYAFGVSGGALTTPVSAKATTAVSANTGSTTESCSPVTEVLKGSNDLMLVSTKVGGRNGGGPVTKNNQFQSWIWTGTTFTFNTVATEKGGTSGISIDIPGGNAYFSQLGANVGVQIAQ